ncbi:hypothetical protein ACN28G_16250 [Micromonospora sp. WMMA1923]|uniref:hypothetical protein n=1 Tax=Micromonospora sp. WMMA1923 TaxID=3404125 RepID=UPI003B94DBA2
MVAPHPFALVCFRLVAGDGASAELLARVNATGRTYLTHTRVAGRYALRLAVGSPQTTSAHVDQVWQLLATTATDLLADRPG